MDVSVDKSRTLISRNSVYNDPNSYSLNPYVYMLLVAGSSKEILPFPRSEPFFAVLQYNLQVMLTGGQTPKSTLQALAATLDKTYVIYFPPSADNSTTTVITKSSKKCK